MERHCSDINYSVDFALHTVTPIAHGADLPHSAFSHFQFPALNAIPTTVVDVVMMGMATAWKCC